LFEEAGIRVEGAFDHVLERLAVELGALHQIVAVVHIGEVVLVVVKLERLARHVRGERIV
jgi:hypothetical protein